MRTITNIIAAALLLVAGLGLAPLGLELGWRVSQWERAHGYPWGRMCDPNIFNFYVSTCR